MFNPLNKTLLLSTTTIGLLWACAQKSDDGFGNGGTPKDPVTDTGPWVATDTGEPDTGTPDTATPDTNDTDTDTAADTGDTAPVIVGTGYAKGDTAFDLLAPDQDEDDWSLHAQFGKVVVVVFGEAWDSRFNTICAYLPDLEAKYGIVAAPVLLTDMSETPADDEDATELATLHSLETVLWDPSIERALQTDWAPLVRPRLFLINEEMEIRWVSEGITNSVQLAEKIEDILF
jgi:hypothetical protein